MDLLREFVIVGGIIMITGLINYVLIKKFKKLGFLLPIISGIIAVVFWILGRQTFDFSRIGLLIVSIIASLTFLGTSITSLIVYILRKTA